VAADRGRSASATSTSPVSLGRHDAVIQFTHRDGTPGRWCLTGRRTVAYKTFVSGGPMSMYRMSRRLRLPIRALSPHG
jgi:hypothetical protein